MHSKPPTRQVHDTLVIGAGPGGLTAAIYLRRFTRKLVLVDKGHSRLRLIPLSHNYPGFPDGVGGARLLQTLECQLGRYGGQITCGEITALRIEDGVFVGSFEPAGPGGESGEIRALSVLLATGTTDAGLPIENWREAVACGAVRLCPVCDGYDVMDKNIAVVTSETNPVGHALFMRTFSARVSLFERAGASMIKEDERRQLDAAGIAYLPSPLRGVTMSAAMQPVLHTEDGERHCFDVFYPMLGETARSELAAALGAQTGECAKLLVDQHQRTSVPGLYAIGDVVLGLNQIAVAVGQAAVAATHIHNSLPWALRPAR
jgi:thioredoxin reductase (NADPH)